MSRIGTDEKIGTDPFVGSSIDQFLTLQALMVAKYLILMITTAYYYHASY